MFEFYHPLGHCIGSIVDILVIVSSFVVGFMYEHYRNWDDAIIATNAMGAVAFLLAVSHGSRDGFFYGGLIFVETLTFTIGITQGLTAGPPESYNVIGKFACGIILLKTVRLFLCACGILLSSSACYLKYKIICKLRMSNRRIFNHNMFIDSFCSVCNSNFAEGDRILQPSCGSHVFHKSCLIRWVQSNSTMCPVCSTCLSTVQVNQKTIQTCLPYHKLNNVITSDDTCSICLNKFIDDCKVSVLNCNNHYHVFHTTCISDWTSIGNSACPLCRTVIDRAKMNIV